MLPSPSLRAMRKAMFSVLAWMCRPSSLSSAVNVALVAPVMATSRSSQRKDAAVA